MRHESESRAIPTPTWFGTGSSQGFSSLPVQPQQTTEVSCVPLARPASSSLMEYPFFPKRSLRPFEDFGIVAGKSIPVKSELAAKHVSVTDVLRSEEPYLSGINITETSPRS